MKSFAVLALAAAVAAQAPEGCESSASGTFQITTVNVTSARKRDLSARQLSGVLTLSLEDGDLLDQAGRTGYIASNYQFQFDSPVQAGARETTGFSLCSNMTLALDDSAIWYQCLSGDFYNLYSQSLGEQCVPIYIQAVMAEGGSGATQISDGQPQVTQPPVVSQISDGQPQASSALVSQISDGQPQASAPGAVTQISDGQPQVTQPPVVSQIPDGQPQAPVATPSGNMTVPINATMSAPPEFEGAAATTGAATGALFAGLLGLLAML